MPVPKSHSSCTRKPRPDHCTYNNSFLLFESLQNKSQFSHAFVTLDPMGKVCSNAYFMETNHTDTEHILLHVHVCREAEIGEDCVGDGAGV